jgi:hypothetical protein
MPAGIRIPVQHNEAQPAAINQQSLFVSCTGCRFAEDASLLVGPGLHVRGAPWRPQMGDRRRSGQGSLEVHVRNRRGWLRLIFGGWSG